MAPDLTRAVSPLFSPLRFVAVLAGRLLRMPPDTPPPPSRSHWAWPPPGATVRRWLVAERGPAGTPVGYAVDPDERPEALHLRALTWLLEEHPRSGPAAGGERRFRLEVARTALPGGRVGHRYALDGAPLGAVGADDARGALWRWVHHVLDAGP